MSTAIQSLEILSLGTDFYDPVPAAHFAQAIPRYLNKKEALALNLKLDSDLEWTRVFAQFQAIPNGLPHPLALRYHGHQFRHYNPDLGDGRGFLFAQLLKTERSGQTRLYDLGTKGSGQTPYSRAGDGRLTLKGAFREALATELLESLGINTSKTFCFFETGERLQRNDEPSPTRGAVLTRLSHGHIRFGTFQRLAYLNQPDNIKKLLKYCMKNYFSDLKYEPEDQTAMAEAFLQEVSRRSARLVAEWMIAGFVHGVLNTDNMNITGESFDYGPYRFLPSYDPAFTAAYFDHNGLYCFGRQPNAVYWNVQQLALALQKAYPDLNSEAVLADFGEVFSASVTDLFLHRLNIKPKIDSVQNVELTDKLLLSFYQALEITQTPFEQTCFDFFGGLSSPRRDSSAQAERYRTEVFADFSTLLRQFEVRNPEKMNHSYFQKSEPCTLLIEEIESIWLEISEHDNWNAFNRKIEDIRAFRGIY